MATIIEAPESNFVPHPEGTFIAIMRDAYFRDRPNPWKGLPRDKKDPNSEIDNRETIREIVLEFLTDQMVEVGGKMLPGFVSYSATPSLADNANLRKFIKGWFPALKDEDLKRFDADKLIGKGAYITVAHNVSRKTGNVWANVVGAMQPPKGSQLPEIPKDFVRHQDKPDNAAPVAQPAQASHPAANATTDVDVDDLPF